MRLKKGELRVHYSKKGMSLQAKERVEVAIDKCLVKLGYHQWASGTELATKVRDIAYSAKEK